MLLVEHKVITDVLHPEKTALHVVQDDSVQTVHLYLRKDGNPFRVADDATEAAALLKFIVYCRADGVSGEYEQTLGEDAVEVVVKSIYNDTQQTYVDTPDYSEWICRFDGACFAKPGLTRTTVRFMTEDGHILHMFPIDFDVVASGSGIRDENGHTSTPTLAEIEASFAELQQSVVDKVPFPVEPDSKYGSIGQVLTTKGDGTTEWTSYATPTDEQTAQAVSAWLDAHPEATTTVEDGSLTEEKFGDALKIKSIKDYLTPEMFGAVGDGTTDDKEAIDAMIAAAGTNAVCMMYNNYYVSAGIEIAKPLNLIMYGTLKVAPTADYCVRISGHDVRRNKFRLNLAVDSTVKSQWDGTYSTIGLDIYGTWENEFDVSVFGFNTGVRLIATNLDCTYNKFFIRYIYNCKTAIFLTGDSTQRTGATAQNTFIGGRIGVQGTAYEWLDENDTDDVYNPLKSVLVGGRTNNNHSFLSVSFEGFGAKPSPYENRAIIKATLNYYVFLGCRYEGITGSNGSSQGGVVISGFGFDDIANKSGGYTNITPDMMIASFAHPITLKRAGNQGDVVDVYNSNNVRLCSLNSSGYPRIPGLKLLERSNLAFSGKELLLKYIPYSSFATRKSEIAADSMEFLPRYGFLVKDDQSNIHVFQPILTAAPASPETGMMALVSGVPQWYDGTNWIKASMEPATVEVTGATATITPVDNTVYECGELTSLTISNPPATGSYSIVFTSGSTATTTTIPSTILGLESFVAEANAMYEINVLDNRAVVGSWVVSNNA